MAHIFVAGLLNVETTLRIEQFPLDYFPVCYPFFGVQSGVSGVGFNVAKALATLGDTVQLAALTGQDAMGQLVRSALDTAGIGQRDVLATLAHTPQSVILYDRDGRRQIHTDLKDIQEHSYPQPETAATAECALAVVCNINFARSLLPIFQRRGIPIASDIHAISDMEDAYNRDFMAAADVLFMSHERLPCPPAEWARQLAARYQPRVIVVGMGGEGALLYLPDEGFMAHLPALASRPVVNTIGAGDALFSAFVHSYARSGDPREALRHATLFAGYKIGETGAANGFLSASALDALAGQHHDLPYTPL